jgi:hypothetical protein
MLLGPHNIGSYFYLGAEQVDITALSGCCRMLARAWHPFSLEPDFPVLSHSGLKTGLHGLNFHKQFQIANLVLWVHFNVFEYKSHKSFVIVKALASSTCKYCMLT